MVYTGQDKTVEVSGRCGGFTFIELLATIVLIGIIMPVAMHGIALCTRIGGQSRNQIEAASLARAKMTELTVSGDWESGERDGDFGSEWPRYRWTADLSNWEDTTLQQLDVEVLWQSQGRERSLVLSTLVSSEEE